MLNSKEISKIKNDLAMISYTHKQFSGIIDNTFVERVIYKYLKER